MHMPIESTADQLATAANEGFTVAHFLAPWIAAKECKGRIGRPEADDRLQWVFIERLVDLLVDTLGLNCQFAKGLAQ